MLTAEEELGVFLACVEIFDLGKEPVPQHDSLLSGHLYYEELMRTGSSARFLNCVRMQRETFLNLVNLLINEGGLRDGKKICAGEKTMILIHILVGHSNRQTAERWQHSGSTIHDVLMETLSAVLACGVILMPRPKADDPQHDRITNNPKFFPFFGDCIGALDGTHISAVVPEDLHNIQT
jgi:hypothetical protein